MTALVLDASLALSWFFDDEATAQTDRLLDRVRNEGAIVPALWRLELGNILLQAERRGRISSQGLAERLALVARMPISVDPETNARAWRDTLDIARDERLTAYDAAYLELAMRRRAPLLTLDQELAAAARRRGCEVHPS